MAAGDEPQAYGWIGRVGRVLEEIPEDAAHGHFLLLTEVVKNLQAVVDAVRTAVSA